jgi:hypothetical protein
MVKITILTGSRAGQTCMPPQNAEPVAVLGDMVEQDWQWEIDFSQASRDETIAWGGADLICRAVRAVKKGLPVTFMGVEYTTLNSLQSFEDAMVESGYCVRVAFDDDRNGLEVHTVHPE